MDYVQCRLANLDCIHCTFVYRSFPSSQFKCVRATFTTRAYALCQCLDYRWRNHNAHIGFDWSDCIDTSDGLVVEVIGHQWWWEVKYPGYDTTLVDEVRIPTGEPVTMRLHSADVIHSFWVPELHGKFDLIPGRVYEFVLQADQPGEYKGRCAEFCGLSHARMTFIVIAMQPEEFTSWLGSQGGN
jgi:heme/copper-type cytochrome/quinol oxidase subunit 2